MISRKMLESLLLEGGFGPIDTNGAGGAGDYISLAYGRRALVVLLTGTWAGGTAAVTLLQATDNAAAGAKALAFTEYWSKTVNSGASVFAKTAVVANTFNLSAAQKMVVIEIDAADLDVDNNFNHFRVDVATPGANADLVAAMYIIGDSRYSSTPENLPDSKL